MAVRSPDNFVDFIQKYNSAFFNTFNRFKLDVFFIDHAFGFFVCENSHCLFNCNFTRATLSIPHALHHVLQLARHLLKSRRTKNFYPDRCTHFDFYFFIIQFSLTKQTAKHFRTGFFLLVFLLIFSIAVQILRTIFGLHSGMHGIETPNFRHLIRILI